MKCQKWSSEFYKLSGIAAPGLKWWSISSYLHPNPPGKFSSIFFHQKPPGPEGLMRTTHSKKASFWQNFHFIKPPIPAIPHTKPLNLERGSTIGASPSTIFWSRLFILWGAFRKKTNGEEPVASWIWEPAEGWYLKGWYCSIPPINRKILPSFFKALLKKQVSCFFKQQRIPPLFWWGLFSSYQVDIWQGFMGFIDLEANPPTRKHPGRIFPDAFCFREAFVATTLAPFSNNPWCSFFGCSLKKKDTFWCLFHGFSEEILFSCS